MSILCDILCDIWQDFCLTYGADKLGLRQHGQGYCSIFMLTSFDGKKCNDGINKI